MVLSTIDLKIVPLRTPSLNELIPIGNTFKKIRELVHKNGILRTTPLREFVFKGSVF